MRKNSHNKWTQKGQIWASTAWSGMGRSIAVGALTAWSVKPRTYGVGNTRGTSSDTIRGGWGGALLYKYVHEKINK